MKIVSLISVLILPRTIYAGRPVFEGPGDGGGFGIFFWGFVVLVVYGVFKIIYENYEDIVKNVVEHLKILFFWILASVVISNVIAALIGFPERDLIYLFCVIFFAIPVVFYLLYEVFNNQPKVKSLTGNTSSYTKISDTVGKSSIKSPVTQKQIQTPQKTQLDKKEKEQKKRGKYHQGKNYLDGVFYKGEMKNGKRHGKGTYTSTNGDKYFGQWKNGKKHGQGKVTLANGVKYKGHWKDGELPVE